MLLPAKALQFIQRTVNNSLKGTAVLSTSTFTSDGMGGDAGSFAAYGTVSCWVLPDKRSMENTIAGQVQAVTYTPIVLPFDCGISNKDRVTHGGVVWEVNGFDDGIDNPGCVVVKGARIGQE